METGVLLFFYFVTAGRDHHPSDQAASEIRLEEKVARFKAHTSKSQQIQQPAKDRSISARLRRLRPLPSDPGSCHVNFTRTTSANQIPTSDE